MTKFDFPLDTFQLARLTSQFREKKDVIVLWMNSLKTIAAYARPDDAKKVGELVLVVDRMSRLFIHTQDKSFSVNFPFSAREVEGTLEFGAPSCPVVDSKVTSDIISLINTNDVLNKRSVSEFADPLLEIYGEQDVIWELLRDLMIADDGYLRIDHDPTNVNGNVHPLDHIDIFYSQSATFKIGLRARFSIESFHDLMNIRTDCFFLGSA